MYYSFNDSFALFCSAFISIAYKIVYFYEYHCDRSWFFAHKLFPQASSCKLAQLFMCNRRAQAECCLRIERMQKSHRDCNFCLRNERCAGCSLRVSYSQKICERCTCSEAKNKKLKLHIESAGKYMDGAIV